MRKIIIITVISSFYLFACNGENNRKDYPTIGEDDVKRMYGNYKKLIASDYHHVILQIAMDQKQLRKFTAGSERVKLFAAAYDKPIYDPETKDSIRTTIIIQIGTRENDKPVYTYFDFRKVFKPKIQAKTDEDDGDNNTICPPPPDCTFPLSKK